MTLDGTVTYLVGDEATVVIDPGPDIASHLDALASHAVGTILLTHQHPDHAAGAASLARRTGSVVRSVAPGTLREGDVIETSDGPLVTICTPGHTPDHAAFHLVSQRVVFCGDLMMGGMDTALVAPPEGNLRDYFASLERVRDLHPARICPAHGPASDEPLPWIERYIEHRRSRLRQVEAALEHGPLTTDGVATHVYGGTIPEALRSWAVGAAQAYLEYLEAEGGTERAGDYWHRIERSG